MRSNYSELRTFFLKMNKNECLSIANIPFIRPSSFYLRMKMINILQYLTCLDKYGPYSAY